MASENVEPQAERDAQPDNREPCWKKKAAADGGLLANVKDHFDEFVNTSMDQHKICLKKSIRGVGDKLKKTGSERLQTFRIQDIFGSSNTETDLGVKEVESSKQVQTTTTQ